jgi:hypothetical protein
MICTKTDNAISKYPSGVITDPGATATDSRKACFTQLNKQSEFKYGGKAQELSRKNDIALLEVKKC